VIEFALTLQESHLTVVREHLLRSDKKERVAYIIFRKSKTNRDPWSGQERYSFLSREVTLVLDDQLLSHTETHVTWPTNSVVQALKRAQIVGGVLAIVHSHPMGSLFFSSQDDLNEVDLIRLAQNRSGSREQLISIVVTPDQRPLARLWHGKRKKSNFEMVRVLGNRFRFHHGRHRKSATTTPFHRQILAFGKGLTEDLQTLRIGIVGCGATGSAVAMLLARLGVGHLLLIDRDTVEETNLNRLHGAGKKDARAHRPKTAVVSRMIRSMGLGTEVRAIRAWIGDPKCRDALKACDVVFGCTDDHDGRLLLNRFAYYYLVPVIDLGLAIEVTNTEPPKVQALDGRVTVLFPGNPCLLCRGIVDPNRAMAEALKRTNPAEYQKRKAEAYVLGEGNPNPAVVTFTTEVATMAVNELLHRMTGYRGEHGDDAQRVRLFHRMHDLRPGAESLESCPVCGSQENWGMGDVEPFLGRVG
jgi:molybdopterin/thiamine biosynthesis adenylyltransferase